MKISHDKKEWKEVNNIKERKQHESKGCIEHHIKKKKKGIEKITNEKSTSHKEREQHI